MASLKIGTVQIVLEVVNRIVRGPLVLGALGQLVCEDGAQIREVTDSGITLLSCCWEPMQNCFTEFHRLDTGTDLIANALRLLGGTQSLV